MLILFRVFRSPSIVVDCAGLLPGSHKLNLFLEICDSTCQQEISPERRLTPRRSFIARSKKLRLRNEGASNMCHLQDFKSF